MTPEHALPPTPGCCPQCKQPLTAVGQFFICPQHGQVSLEKPLVPMRIFLSYGHDANEELVRRIKADLEKRGHDVWFDKSEIRFGDDWRRAITDGIVASNRVLSFLSKYSTRDPGVCLDELAIAIGVKGGNIQTVLVESEAEVKPPPSIGHIQWLDMHDWKEQRVAGEAAWETWYQGRLAEIVRVIESDESRRFAGEIETLNGYLKPISSDSRISALLRKGFVGRVWLFDAIEQWRNSSDRASRLFWIVGDPGVGKSAAAAHLTHFGRDKVIAAQFVEWDKPDHRSAQRVVRSIAFQLATRLPEYRKLLLTLPEIAELDRKGPAELFDYLLATPLHSVIDGGRERYLIVIDALDEAGEAGRNPLVEMLARNASRLPEWIGIVVTSRPESAVKTPLQGLNPLVLDTGTDDNRADIRDYLRHELALQLENRPDADRLIEQILEKSEGVFLYVERVCHDLQQGHLTLERPDQFPQGLGGVFCQFFDRQFPDLEKFRRDIRPALRAILAAREPLPIEILQRLFNWQDEDLCDFTRILGSFFPVTSEAGHEVIKPYHKSLADWLADEGKAGRYFVSVTQGHRALADLGWDEFNHHSRHVHSYFLNWLHYHLVELRHDGRLVALISSQWFWENSRVFFRPEFYSDVLRCLSITRAFETLTQAHQFFAQRAIAVSPQKLGFTLFPHEPGVTFVNGTRHRGGVWPFQEYTIPPGAKDPPLDVLWEFIRTCDTVFHSSAAFLRGVPDSIVAEWYRDYWKKSGLQDTLDDIERYYDSCYLHLAHRAMELSWKIDEATKQPVGDIPSPNPPNQGKA